MIRHIVFWRLKAEAEGHSMQENFETIKAGLESLVGKAQGLYKAEVRQALCQTDYNVCLYSEFENKAALDAYQNFPDHLKVKQFVHKVVEGRTACDVEV